MLSLLLKLLGELLQPGVEKLHPVEVEECCLGRVEKRHQLREEILDEALPEGVFA